MSEKSEPNALTCAPELRVNEPLFKMFAVPIEERQKDTGGS